MYRSTPRGDAMAKRAAAKKPAVKKPAAADWMPQDETFKHVRKVAGSADLAIRDIDKKVTAGELRWATRTEADDEPVEQTVKTWSTKWKLWPPPILAQPSDQSGDEQFVFFLRSDLMRIWPTKRTAEPAHDPPGQRGRPPKYDWQKFDVAVCRLIYTTHQGKIPEKPDPLVTSMRAWCLRNFKQVPDETRKRIARVLKLLAE